VNVNTIFRDDCQVAIVGAGPYGLSLAAHLSSAMVDARVYGRPMSFWRHNMPKGMKLRSAWDASHIVDPDGLLSLDVYAVVGGLGRSAPLTREDFIRYGDWFQETALPDLDARNVEKIEPTGRGFWLTLQDGQAVNARRIVVATGLAKQQFRPAPFRGLPAELVSHSADHASLDVFRGRRVAVIGRGQSACESAALLAEGGAEVEMICRGAIRWAGSQNPGDARRHAVFRRAHRMLDISSALGPFPFNWLNAAPGTMYRVPPGWRVWLDGFGLRANAAAWLRPRLAGVRIDAGRRIHRARPDRDGVILDMDDGSRGFDHVLLATGYKIDIARLGFLGPELTSRIITDGGSPVLSPSYESSLPGLHFIGPSAVKSFGPLLGQVAGAGHAARAVTAHVKPDPSGPRRRRPVMPEPETLARPETAPPLNRTAAQRP
jgi:cation diffusion facilitator CzcD-associated flavoprotein CzcO